MFPTEPPKKESSIENSASQPADGSFQRRRQSRVTQRVVQATERRDTLNVNGVPTKQNAPPSRTLHTPNRGSTHERREQRRAHQQTRGRKTRQAEPANKQGCSEASPPCHLGRSAPKFDFPVLSQESCGVRRGSKTARAERKREREAGKSSFSALVFASSSLL